MIYRHHQDCRTIPDKPFKNNSPAIFPGHPQSAYSNLSRPNEIFSNYSKDKRPSPCHKFFAI